MFKMKLNYGISIAVIPLLILTFYCYYLSTNPVPLPRATACDNSDSVLELRKILSILETHPNTFNYDIALKIAKVIHTLDSNANEDLHFNEKSELSASQTSYTCPEKFLHAKYGDPYFMSGSWITENCGSTHSMASLLTVIIAPCESGKCILRSLIREIKKHHPGLSILLALPEKSKCLSTAPIDSLIIKVPTNATLGEKLTRLVSQVHTPLVLVARNLDHFDWLSRLERQISIFSLEPRAQIVGGSFRNKTGHWQSGCYQSELKYYTLKYTNGYYKSKHECMYCDHLLGPFIAKTNILRDIKFDSELNEEVVFEDFFLRVKNNSGSVVFICPDAMYHATDRSIVTRVIDRNTWFTLTKKHQLNRVVLPDGVIHKFSCSESNLNCKHLNKLGAMMMPICCRDALVNGYKAIHQYCIENNVTYQILGGSTLGAVKFGDVIPWDFDGDAMYYHDKMHLFYKSLDLSTFDGEVYIDHVDYKANGFFYVSTPDAFIEFWAESQLSIDVTNLSDIFRVKPTLVRIGDGWVYGPPSPGLYARNYYGYEMLRHSNGYHALGRSDWLSPYNTSAPFIKCQFEHHACLDQFFTDGSIQFVIP